MKTFLNIVFWASISFIITFLLIGLLGLILPIEIIDDKIENLYFSIRFFGFPIAIILTLTGTIKPNDKIGLIIGKIIATIAGVIVSILIGFSVLFASVCAWVSDDVIFENKIDASTRIEIRHFDCGAIGNGEPRYKAFKVKKMTSFLIWATKVDTNKINKDEWKRMKIE